MATGSGLAGLVTWTPYTAALCGSTRTATRAAEGTSSRRSSSRFAVSSATKKLIPVTLPLGWARLATRPSLTGSSAAAKTIGIVLCRRLGRHRRDRAHGSNHGELIGGSGQSQEFRQSIVLILGKAVHDRRILAFDEARLREALAERAQTMGAIGSCVPLKTKPIVGGLSGRLRPYCERPEATLPSSVTKSRRSI